ncbi:hypothetical protein BH20ACI1_BH20ACI1_12130 [soil metagenome]
MKIIKIGLILSAIALFIFACAENKTTVNTNTIVNAPVNVPTNTQPTTVMDEMASAKKIYMDNCAKCHKEDGTGGKVVIDGETLNAENLTSAHAKKEVDAELIEHIKDGIPDEGMPAFKDRLSDEQIKMVVKYIRVDLQKK